MVDVTTTTFEERLADLAQKARERSVELQRPVLLSIREEYEAVDPLRLFANSTAYASERWYWERPEEGLSVAAIGVASGTMPPWRVRFAEADRLRQEITGNAMIDPPDERDRSLPFAFAAFSFDPQRKPDRRAWKGFPPVYLYVPRAMFVRDGDRHVLTFNLQISPNREADTLQKLTLDLRNRVLGSLDKEIPDSNPSIDAEPDDADDELIGQYQASVASAAESIRTGEFEKVVLARYRDVRAENYFAVPKALDRLRQDYPGCYTFAVARHGSVFLGSTPEQLVRLNGKQVSTVCLAGSIRRGATPEEDEALGQQLLASSKDRHEHEVCVRAIREAVEPLCSELNVPDEPSLMTVSNVHHLRTPVEGTLSNGATLIQLVERLHPTPAVGGYPKEKSVEFLRENEGFDRGWYASPLGWLDADGNGEFVVTLRSAVISGLRARLFAGCGIVGESDPQQELAESNVKLRPMLSALEG